MQNNGRQMVQKEAQMVTNRQICSTGYHTYSDDTAATLVYSQIPKCIQNDVTAQHFGWDDGK